MPLYRQLATLLIEDDQLVVSGDQAIGEIVQQSVDLYHQFDQPRIADYQVLFQAQHVMVHVGSQQFILSQHKEKQPVYPPEWDGRDIP